jgi:hypothetical protein
MMLKSAGYSFYDLLVTARSNQVLITFVDNLNDCAYWEDEQYTLEIVAGRMMRKP